MLTFPNTPTAVAIAGDWHASKGFARRVIRQVAGEVEIILHAGDFGWRFAKDHMSVYEAEAAKAGLVIAFVDGNHEDHDKLDSYPVDADGIRRLSDHVWHLPRGFRWEWYGVRWLALGGAISIDKSYRREGVSWWYQEAITWAQAEEVIAAGPADVMLTHDRPDLVEGRGTKGLLSGFPQADILAAQQHSRLLGEVVDAVRPRVLFHGHYHDRYDSVRTYADGQQCRIVGLGRDELPFEDNYVVIDPRAPIS